MTKRTFLTAEWKNLLMFNYVVEPALVDRFVPHGTELDSFAGQTYISLIGFEFNRTCIAGARVPFHQSFEEVNLRFYVKREDRRGVVFIRELVPKPAVVAIARAMFGENYACTQMSHSIQVSGESVNAEYTFGAGKTRCTMRIQTDAFPYLPADDSLAQFITEHYWGYARRNDRAALEYEVQHPRWLVRNASQFEFSGDATSFYGAEFADNLRRPPDSAFLAEGSAVTVFRGVRI